MAESTDLALREEAAVRKAIMEGGKLATIEDPLEIQRAIFARIMEAETPEEVFAQAGTTPWQDHIGRPFIVHAIRWLNSSYEEGAPVYALVEAADPETGEAVLLSCGGVNVMAQLLKLRGLDALPLAVKLMQAPKETAQGFRPLWLAPVE